MIRVLYIVLVGFALTCTGVAYGQPSDSTTEAQAQRLFDEGRALMEQGRYSEACPKLLASERLSSSGGTLLNLASCYEKEGKLASAWARFREAAARAAAANKPDIEKHANERALALAPQLSTLTITVPPASDVPGLVVKRDGALVERGAWGSALPVDAGTYAIEASAPGHARFESRIVVKGGADRESIVVPVLEREREVAHEEAPVKEPPPPTDEGWPTSKKLGLVAGAFGVFGLGVGSFFGLRAMSLNDDAVSHCPASPRCNDPAGPELTRDAQSAATVSTIAFIAGAALLVGGAVLWFTAPGRSSASASRF